MEAIWQDFNSRTRPSWQDLMLDQNLKNQVSEYFKLLEKEVVISVDLDDTENSRDLKKFLSLIHI